MKKYIIVKNIKGGIYMEIFNKIGDFANKTYQKTTQKTGEIAKEAKIKFKMNDDKYKIMFLFFITYLMQSFVNISMVACASIYWIMLGAIVQQYRLAKEEEPDNVNAMSL